MKLQQICVKLWCEVPGGSGNCKTAEMPAADGTPCGNGKVLFVLIFRDPFTNSNEMRQVFTCKYIYDFNGGRTSSIYSLRF